MPLKEENVKKLVELVKTIIANASPEIVFKAIIDHEYRSIELQTPLF
jgi:hypothetical protein